MKISFTKIGISPSVYKIEQDFINFEVTLSKKKADLVLCEGKIVGDTTVSCDRCAQDFTQNVNESFSFLIQKGVYEGNDDDYDVVEIHEEMICLEELLESELEMFKSSYFYCKNCIE